MARHSCEDHPAKEAVFAKNVNLGFSVSHSTSLSESIKQRALDAGFDLAGIAPADVWRDLEFARQWVEAGYGGEMDYLANAKRHDPRRVLSSVQSVVCVGLIYNAPRPYSTEINQERAASVLEPAAGGESRAWISRYAWGSDYHALMRRRLEQLRSEIESMAPEAETRVYADTGPVVERAFARYSGIGWTGKNTCLINEGKGSWFFLGVILTNLMLRPDPPAADRCGSCTRCLDACPTRALIQPYVMNASRCIAYLTIELKDSMPEPLRAGVGSNVFGCDICQDVCPWNSPHASGSRDTVTAQRRPGAATTDLPEFQPLEIETGDPENSLAEPGGPAEAMTAHVSQLTSSLPHVSLFAPALQILAALDEERFARVFSRSPVKRAKYRGWLRNLCVVMGNSADRSFIPWLERAAKHADGVVREHAEWALGRLQKEERLAKK
ncbi:MAG: tRNA epoxyqueuosine(34) reductase QueG [Terriglobia bacterium]